MGTSNNFGCLRTDHQQSLPEPFGQGDRAEPPAGLRRGLGGLLAGIGGSGGDKGSGGDRELLAGTGGSGGDGGLPGSRGGKSVKSRLPKPLCACLWLCLAERGGGDGGDGGGVAGLGEREGKRERGREVEGEGARLPAIGKAPQRHLPAGLQRNVKPNHLQVKDRTRSVLSQGLNSSLSAWLLAKLCLSACLCLLLAALIFP